MTVRETPAAGESATEQPSGDAATTGDADSPRDESVLILADHPNAGKIERHYGPLADVTRETTMVCIDGDDAVDGIRFREVPAPGHRLLGLPLLFLVGLVEALRGEYDAVVSISLVPYGVFALLAGRLTGTPVHLGIIGADIDRHAEAWYGAAVREAFRRFDSLSVPGSAHVRYLVAAGVDPDRVSVLTNAIDTGTYRPPAAPDRDVDFVWVGRFSQEKAPVRFVEALAELRERGREFDAVMLGDGDRMPAVRRALARHGLGARVELPGWVDDPVDYYRRSRVFVLTSQREGLPLTLVEAMATGVVPVVPPVGSVADVAEDGHNAVVVPDRGAGSLADGMARLLAEPDLCAELAARAPDLREDYSYDAARKDWRAILDVLWVQG